MRKTTEERLKELETEVSLINYHQEQLKEIRIYDSSWDGYKSFNIHDVVRLIMDYLGITIENKGDVVVRKEKDKEAKEKIDK